MARSSSGRQRAPVSGEVDVRVGPVGHQRLAELDHGRGELACRSSAATMGRRGATARSRRSSSPSPSSRCSVTMAPCRSRNRPSSGPAATRSSTSMAASRSKASSVTGPDGQALAQSQRHQLVAGRTGGVDEAGDREIDAGAARRASPRRAAAAASRRPRRSARRSRPAARSCWSRDADRRSRSVPWQRTSPLRARERRKVPRQLPRPSCGGNHACLS